ncbi:hypothetical protein RL2958 [Rhizobium johnstonii 3841]|uniref:Uncharacterized protein n=1 Tax=Rhizobium johnstonii (strain DSM 114642 / LMG 32736 / 3841) TaxID=216596 RepID=Q1MF26_RHIJ3|nr:hypothetical protein RL2958 [Rhizobium johnstonii 3841]
MRLSSAVRSQRSSQLSMQPRYLWISYRPATPEPASRRSHFSVWIFRFNDFSELNRVFDRQPTLGECLDEIVLISLRDLNVDRSGRSGTLNVRNRSVVDKLLCNARYSFRIDPRYVA